MNLFFAILEDDINLLKYYKSEIEGILQKHCISGGVVCATDNPVLFMDMVKTFKANVCIIDINLKTNTNGMQIARDIRSLKIPAEIIFITGHLQYMKNAFQVRAFDYIEKPVTGESMEKCILRLYREMDPKAVTRQEVIKVKSGSVVYHIPVDEIMYIEHVSFKSIIITSNKHIETYESLSGIAKALPQGKFKQCHRAIWVNTSQIDCVDLKKDEIRLRNGMRCSLGRTFRKEFAKYAI